MKKNASKETETGRDVVLSIRIPLGAAERLDALAELIPFNMGSRHGIARAALLAGLDVLERSTVVPPKSVARRARGTAQKK